VRKQGIKSQAPIAIMPRVQDGYKMPHVPETVHYDRFEGKDHHGNPKIRPAHDKYTKGLGWGDLWLKKVKLPPMGDQDSDTIPNLFDKYPLRAGGVEQVLGANVACGNKKLHRAIGIWSLPPITTCRGSTPLCRRYCYARYADVTRADVYASLQRNYHLAKKCIGNKEGRRAFVEYVSPLIDKACKTTPLGRFFRIHESGDFFDQDYVEAWKEIAESKPDIWFLAFTKTAQASNKFNFNNLPSNLCIRMSTDPSSSKEAIDGMNGQGLSECFVGRKDKGKFIRVYRMDNKKGSPLMSGYAPPDDKEFQICPCTDLNGNAVPRRGCTPEIMDGKGNYRYDETCVRCWNKDIDTFLVVHGSSVKHIYEGQK